MAVDTRAGSDFVRAITQTSLHGSWVLAQSPEHFRQSIAIQAIQLEIGDNAYDYWFPIPDANLFSDGIFAGKEGR